MGRRIGESYCVWGLYFEEGGWIVLRDHSKATSTSKTLGTFPSPYLSPSPDISSSSSTLSPSPSATTNSPPPTYSLASAYIPSASSSALPPSLSHCVLEPVPEFISLSFYEDRVGNDRLRDRRREERVTGWDKGRGEGERERERADEGRREEMEKNIAKEEERKREERRRLEEKGREEERGRLEAIRREEREREIRIERMRQKWWGNQDPRERDTLLNSRTQNADSVQMKFREKKLEKERERGKEWERERLREREREERQKEKEEEEESAWESVERHKAIEWEKRRERDRKWVEEVYRLKRQRAGSGWQGYSWERENERTGVSFGAGLSIERGREEWGGERRVESGEREERESNRIDKIQNEVSFDRKRKRDAEEGRERIQQSQVTKSLREGEGGREGESEREENREREREKEEECRPCAKRRKNKEDKFDSANLERSNKNVEVIVIDDTDEGEIGDIGRGEEEDGGRGEGEDERGRESGKG